MVQHGPRELIETEFDLTPPRPGELILRVDACGLCGTDVDALAGRDIAVQREREGGLPAFPRIAGHEIVGTIVARGEGGRSDVAVGDRVAVDPWLPCGRCRQCLAGRSMHCEGWPFRPACYGFIPLSVEPGLWGGYASHCRLHPQTVLYPLPAELPAATATLWNALGAGIQWGVMTPQTSIGETVVILGCGQRGIASAVAARAAGARLVVVTGLARDAAKLALARELGVDAAIDIEAEDAVERVAALTGGDGADVVVDTSAGSTAPINDSVALVREGGRIVWAGLKSKSVDGFPIDDAIHKSARIDPVLGVSAEAYRLAVDLLGTGQTGLERMQTHRIDFREAERAVDVLAGKVPGEGAISVALTNVGD
jgi:threonine dehydrogenase-like Zn-dependent dehydrogenase